MNESKTAVLCPGQGAQFVGMGRAWFEHSEAARATFREADEVLGDDLGAPLSVLCFEGPEASLTRTDASQPAIYTCSVACWRGLLERCDAAPDIAAAAGLSLGEYTALHLAGVFSFVEGLRLVALRGRLMQEAAGRSEGGMVALIGADEQQAEDLCAEVRGDEVLVPANFNAPGQIVLSGHKTACDRAWSAAGDKGFRATPLQVAGAFHSALMEPATGPMREALAAVPFQSPNIEVWSNVTGAPHDPGNAELLKQRLVEQIVSPVRWAQSCQALAAAGTIAQWLELAPGSVLKGLMRRIDRNVKVISHDEPTLVTS